jgi:hypothetical protein
LATLLEPVVEIWRFNFFPFEIWCIMAFCLLQKSFAYVEIIFSTKKEVKICSEGEMTTRFGDYLDRRWWMRLLSLFPCLIRIELCNSSASCWGCCTKLAIPILMNDVDLKPSYVPIVTVETSLHILNINVFIKMCSK